MTESRTRSLAKALSWRISATAATMILVFALTGQWAVAATIGGLEVVVKMVLYFMHERAWGRIDYGRRQQEPAVIWLTGLSGSGKTTIGNRLAQRLREIGRKVERLDGDVTRAIFPQTGFSKEDRDANVVKAGFLAQMLERNGVDVVASYISPYRETRDEVRGMCGRFIEVYVATPLAVCESRDVKGLYAKARSGEIEHFTGIDDPYQAPTAAELVIDTTHLSVDQACDRILQFMGLNT